MHTARVSYSLRGAMARLADWQFVGLLLVGTRLALTIAGFLGVALLGEGFRRLDLAPDLSWLQLWAQWDSEHYLNIATQGYSYTPGTYSNIPFFPLYPALIGLVLTVIGRVDIQTGAMVGFVIANVTLFVALTYLTGARGARPRAIDGAPNRRLTSSVSRRRFSCPRSTPNRSFWPPARQPCTTPEAASGTAPASRVAWPR